MRGTLAVSGPERKPGMWICGGVPASGALSLGQLMVKCGERGSPVDKFLLSVSLASGVQVGLGCWCSNELGLCCQSACSMGLGAKPERVDGFGNMNFCFRWPHRRL